MISVPSILQSALKDAHLDVAELAAWARLDEKLLQEVMAGTSRLSAADLDRIACVFGLRLDDLLEGKAATAPMTLLLRSSADNPALDIRSALTLEVDWVLGEFQRVARDVTDLGDVVELPVWSEKLDGFESSSMPLSRQHPSEARARDLRRHLGLGLDPIPSMHRLLASLGVFVVWVNEELDDAGVDGACTLLPRPSILVNSGGNAPWRARMTMAHELSHLLFDLSSESPVLVSPHRRGLSQWLEEKERSASAFAAAFLAPAEAVQQLITGLDPSSEEAVQRVGEHFGLGHITVINRLVDIYRLTETLRRTMLARPGKYRADFSGDQPPREAGLRGDPFRSLVGKALGLGRISPYRARQMLGVSPAERLPFALPDEVVGPPVTPEQQIRRQAHVHLARTYPARALTSAHAERQPGAWKVSVMESRPGQGPINAGVLFLSLSGELLQDMVALPAPGPR